MSRNWEELGISWETETVRHQAGDHATDKVTLGEAQIAVVTDLDLFKAAVGEEVILKIMDGTSIRVMAQDVGRRMLKAGSKNIEAMREAVYNRILGQRNSGGPRIREGKVYPRPKGGTYKGTDAVEYQQTYLSELVDLGTPLAVAQSIVANLSL